MDFTQLVKTPLFQAFSELGKRIFLPEGIIYWSRRAEKEADLIGTIGTAFGYEKDFIDGGSDDWSPCHLKDFKDYSSLNIRSIVPYASVGGIAGIREIWKDWILKKTKYNEETEKEKINLIDKYITTPIVTQGITNGIFMSCSLLLNPGEYIIIPNKRWGNYDNIITRFIDARIKSFNFFKDQKIDIEGLKQAIKEISTKQDKIVLLLNFPNNPTGYVPSKDEAIEIVNALKEIQKELKRPIIVLVDDAYEPFIYNDEALDKSIFYDLLELDEDVIPIKLDGISKELLAYGGRVGFVTIGLKPNWVENDEQLEILKKEINNKLEGINRSTISNTNHFYQAVTQKMFIDKGVNKIIQKREKIKLLLQKRYELINSELAKIESSDFSVDPNSGGFFLFVNLNPNKIKAPEFANHLLKKYKVGVIPIEKRDDNINGIRIAYCSIDLEKIPEFINRINLALKDF